MGGVGTRSVYLSPVAGDHANRMRSQPNKAVQLTPNVIDSIGRQPLFELLHLLTHLRVSA